MSTPSAALTSVMKVLPLANTATRKSRRTVLKAPADLFGILSSVNIAAHCNGSASKQKVWQYPAEKAGVLPAFSIYLLGVPLPIDTLLKRQTGRPLRIVPHALSIHKIQAAVVGKGVNLMELTPQIQSSKRHHFYLLSPP